MGTMEKDGARLQNKDGARSIPFARNIPLTNHGAAASDDARSRKTKAVAGAKNTTLRRTRMTEVARTTNSAVRKHSITAMCHTHTAQHSGTVGEHIFEHLEEHGRETGIGKHSSR